MEMLSALINRKKHVCMCAINIFLFSKSGKGIKNLLKPEWWQEELM